MSMRPFACNPVARPRLAHSYIVVCGRRRFCTPGRNRTGTPLRQLILSQSRLPLRHGGMSLLRRPDSNGEYKCQKLGCYHYTTAQSQCKYKVNFLITKENNKIFSKKFGPVHNPGIPTDGTGGQRLFKRGVRGGVSAQFEPMFVFGPLDHYPANAVRVPDNMGVNLCCHRVRQSVFLTVQSCVFFHRPRFFRRTYTQVVHT